MRAQLRRPVAQHVQRRHDGGEVGVADALRRDRGDLLAVGGDVLVGGGHQRVVLRVGQRPGAQQAEHQHGGHSTGDPAGARHAAAQLRVGGDDVGLGEHHRVQKAGEEVALLLADERGLARHLHAERAGHRVHQPVDRRAGLGAGGEVDAAQQRPLVELRGGEDLLEDLVQRLLQGGHLQREAEDQAAAGDVGLLLQALQHDGVHPRQQLVELGVEGGRGRRGAGLAVVEREGHAPDLLAVGPVVGVEELHEAGDQIGLGQQDVDREAAAESAGQFAQALADGLRVGQPLGRVAGGDVFEA